MFKGQELPGLLQYWIAITPLLIQYPPMIAIGNLLHIAISPKPTVLISMEEAIVCLPELY
jgi:hypothetical protein